ncbi:hypothetical protein CF131_06150 [Aeromonas dhakensis]|nr:hypothetical protein CF131_06150 [Aeromonas dhakensis]TNI39692.1 hypothetical protein CF130_21200 [Aeromonas dhakensis]
MVLAVRVMVGKGRGLIILKCPALVKTRFMSLGLNIVLAFVRVGQSAFLIWQPSIRNMMKQKSS